VDRVERGVVVDDHLRSSVPTSTRRATWRRARPHHRPSAVHAIEPTAQEHGRVVGANMAGKDVRYRGSLIINIVEVCHLDAASFGAWDDAKAEAISGSEGPHRLPQAALPRVTADGAIIIGRSNDIWTTNDVGMLKGLVQSGGDLGATRTTCAAIRST
jgi:hypothetical protein